MTSKLSNIPDAYDLDDELFEDSEQKSDWEKSARKVVDVFTQMSRHLDNLPAYDDEESDATTELRDRIQELVESYIERMNDEGWEDSRKYYTLGKVSAATLAAAARLEMMDWEDALHAVAMGGTAAGVKTVLAQMEEADVSPDLGDALNWAADPGDLTPDLYFGGNVETAAALLDAGAPASYNDGQLFREIVRGGNADMARLFSRAGQTDPDFSLEYWHKNARDYFQSTQERDMLRDLYWEFGRFQAVDQATLVERKKMDDGAQLRVIFDFAARRVSEIYMANHDVAPLKTEIGFDDYGPAALRAAREKLCELGGKPPADEPPAVHQRIHKSGLRTPGRG